VPVPLTAAAVVNQALQGVGGFNNDGPVTGSFPNFVGGTAAEAANTVYQECVQVVGRKFGWDFSRNVAELTDTGNTPPLGWLYEYIYPTSGIQVRQVLPPDADVDALDPRPQRWGIGTAVGGSTAASGSITFSLNPTNGSTITLNGRAFTFVTSGGWPSVQTNYQINIGGNLGGTLFFLEQALTTGATYLADSLINVADYSIPSTALLIDYIVPGTGGNSYTLAASVATVSGPTLTGGVTSLQKVIWTDIADAQAVFSGQPSESTWDPLFAESVVQVLTSKLAQALSSKPDSAKLAAAQAAAVEEAGETRTDT
jgi:hypothetical protein